MIRSMVGALIALKIAGLTVIPWALLMMGAIIAIGVCLLTLTKGELGGRDSLLNCIW